MTSGVRSQRNILVLIALCAALEISLRIAGLIDFPLYQVDDQIGYIIRPSQSGAFLRTHSWVYNDRSMGTGVGWNPTGRPNVLLIGNSIVMGGNPYAQPQKLGPLVQGLLGSRVTVWPIGVGGWTEVNESIYLERNPDVTKSAKFFVWIVMRGGLSQLSLWRGEYVFPSTRPPSATWYALRRYVLPHVLPLNTNELPPQGAPSTRNLQLFEAEVAKLSVAAGRSVPGILVLYPGEADLAEARSGREWLAERPAIEQLTAKYGVKILDLSRQPEWTGDLYRDGTHPTVESNRTLARIISSAVREFYRP